FFFQAEDGIRDFHVTGVQTCALPIFGQRIRAIVRRIRRFALTCKCDSLRQRRHCSPLSYFLPNSPDLPDSSGIFPAINSATLSKPLATRDLGSASTTGRPSLTDAATDASEGTAAEIGIRRAASISLLSNFALELDRFMTSLTLLVLNLRRRSVSSASLAFMTDGRS